MPVALLLNPDNRLQALGVLLYLMCFGRFPFECGPNERLDQLVLSGRFHMPPSSHCGATRDLVVAMLRVRPHERPDVHQVLAAIRRILGPSHPPPQMVLSLIHI